LSSVPNAITWKAKASNFANVKPITSSLNVTEKNKKGTCAGNASSKPPSAKASRNTGTHTLTSTPKPEEEKKELSRNEKKM